MPGAYCNLLYHFVFSTKERRPLIAPAINRACRNTFGAFSERSKANYSNSTALPIMCICWCGCIPRAAWPKRASHDQGQLLQVDEQNGWARTAIRLAGGLRSLHGQPVTSAATADLHPWPREAPSPCGFPERAFIALLRRNRIAFEERYLL